MLGKGRCVAGLGGAGGTDAGRALAVRLGTAGALLTWRTGGGGGVSAPDRWALAAADGRGGRLARGAEAGGVSSLAPAAAAPSSTDSTSTSSSPLGGASLSEAPASAREASNVALSAVPRVSPVLPLRVSLPSARVPVGRGTLGDFFAMWSESLTQSPGPRRGSDTIHQKTDL